MQSDRTTAYLLLGSNLGDREKMIADAITFINARVGDVLHLSGLYETAAWGNTDQPSFLNLVLAVETVLSPNKLLEAVLKIEADLGRVRHDKWGARLIDIDIIFYGEEVISQPPQLQIPHPEMQRRRFVLLPLAEIASTFVHPIFKKTVANLLEDLSDNLSVQLRQ
ncbi:MAG: 2-amino-4-hydroxy-6-hydroxymethyldihydropteridine diphosphokinase [Bacteroidia bacterium]